MATLNYLEPALFISEQEKSPLVREYPAASGQAIARADLVTLAAGQVSRAATNVSANIAGLAIHGVGQIFGQQPGAAASTSTLFGFVQPGLLPAEPGDIHVNSLLNQTLEMSLINTTTWAASLIGTTAGIVLDGTTNLYIVDPGQSNKIVTIYQKPVGPAKGTVGDNGVRVIVTFAATALV